MALTLHTNCGFVSEAPVADPAGTNVSFDTRALVAKDTAPVGATSITEIGWYCDNATEEANFEIALYDSDGAVVPGEAGTRLYVDTINAKGTSAGWIKVTGLAWDITAEHVYWIGIAIADTATTSNGNYATSGGAGYDYIASVTLPNPFGGGALSDADGLLGIYAVYAAGGGLSISLSENLVF